MSESLSERNARLKGDRTHARPNKRPEEMTDAELDRAYKVAAVRKQQSKKFSWKRIVLAFVVLIVSTIALGPLGLLIAAAVLIVLAIASSLS